MERACERSWAERVVVSRMKTKVTRSGIGIMHLAGRFSWRAFCGSMREVVKLRLVAPEVSNDEDCNFRSEGEHKKTLPSARTAKVLSQVDFQIVHEGQGSRVELGRVLLHDQARRGGSEHRLGLVGQEYLRGADDVRPGGKQQGVRRNDSIRRLRGQLQWRELIGRDGVGQVAEQGVPPEMAHLVADEFAHVDGTGLELQWRLGFGRDDVP